MERGFMQTVIDYLSLLVPAKGEAYLMLASGVIVSGAAWALGGIDLQIQWLMIFVVIDYVTGTFAAFKTGDWCSCVGFRGLFKKFFIFVVIAGMHGLDVISGTDVLRNGAIAAYAVNELGSTLENFDRLGFGGMIPDFLRRAIKEIKSKEVIKK